MFFFFFECWEKKSAFEKATSNNSKLKSADSCPHLVTEQQQAIMTCSQSNNTPDMLDCTLLSPFNVLSKVTL